MIRFPDVSPPPPTMKNVLTDMPAEAKALKELQNLAAVRLISSAESPEHAHVLFCDALPGNFDEMKNLEWLQIGSVGYSHLYGHQLSSRGIAVTNARGVFDVPIAEWSIAMMIYLARDMSAMFRHQQARVWDRDARFQTEIRGRRLGIYGYGGIGRETARLAKALGLEVWVLARQSALKKRDDVYIVPGTGDPEAVLPDRVFSADEKYEFLSGLDCLLLAMPLTPHTEGIIGEAELRALPPTATILNPARGPLIKEEALLRALRENWISGAALDTHYEYPLRPEHPLWAMPNVVLTPHISGSSASTHYLTRVWDIFRINLHRHVRGEHLLNKIAPEEFD